MDPHPDPVAEIEAALARARPVADGGPYLRLRPAEACEEARQVAAAAPLAGFSLAVKDLIAVGGWPLGAGTRLREEAGPEPADARVVAALRRAGAVLTGTVVLHEIALGVTGVNPYAGTPANPHAPGCVPGGSSSGSAVAVADGSARVALGTDTGGSGRIPAAFCGVVGFKPAFGSYPTEGVLPLAPTFDHVSLVTRTVADAARVHAVLAAPAGPARAAPPGVGLLPSTLAAADPEVARAVERAGDRLARAGCAVREVEVADDAEVLWATTTVIFAEAAMSYAADRERWPTHVGADVRARLDTGAALPRDEYRDALRRRHEVARAVGRRLEEVDLLLSPTVPIPPPRLAGAGDPALPARIVANTRIANLTGIPAISLPLGDGIGLQLMGRTDAALLSDAAWAEAVLARSG